MGFGGPLEILVGFERGRANILGYTILATVGNPPDWVCKADTWFQEGGKGNIIGRNPGEKELAVSKDGGDIDAITASTITSRAFLNAVNAAYQAFKEIPAMQRAEPAYRPDGWKTQPEPEVILFIKERRDVI